MTQYYDDTGIRDALERFRPEVVQRNVLKRFITENPISKQRMIATSRTASETRFLFHSKDTALLHVMDSSIFSKKQSKSHEEYNRWKYVMDEWKNTIDCQVEHEETQDLKWRKPLWYALAFILASKDRSINSMPPEALLHSTWMTLLGMTSSSGLFPGLLTSSRTPMEFEEETYRDTYWQTTFEVPHILWRCGKGKVTKFTSTDGFPLPRMPQNDQEISSSKRKSGFMAKKLQFANSNKFIDPKGLVEISDDWLQQGPQALKFGLDPGFLRFEGPNKSNPVIRKVKIFPHCSEELVSAALDAYHLESKDEKMATLFTSEQNANSFTDEKRVKGRVVDVPRGAKGARGGLDSNLQNNRELAVRLGQQRDVQSAKKRFIWLPKADRETALICCLASPPDEQYYLSAFFDRHALYDKYFSDETSVTLNEWKTEFQLSFYRLAGFAEPDDFHEEEGIPKFSYVVAHSTAVRKGAVNPKAKPDMATGIVRAAMGFRFVGDFFDRYWTCHFLEYIPGNPPPKKTPNEDTTMERSNAVEPCSEHASGSDPKVAPTIMESITQEKYIQSQLTDPQTGKTKYPWQQRKVLELLLFDQILLHIEKETEDIFNWARVSVLKASGATNGAESKYSTKKAQESVLGVHGADDSAQPYKMAASDPLNPLSEAIDSAYQFVELGDSEGYFNVIGRWRLFEEILQTLGEDLTENLERIEEWSRREEDRVPESPRWTRNDERLFRNTMNKLRVQNQRKIRNLERLNARIKTFRDSLTGRLESIREDMSFRGSENMSLFTYVTVIFLPLGFATGIFSMNEAPGNPTLTFMIATAITSLSITVFALANAKHLRKNIVEPLIEFVQSVGRPVISIVLVPCLFMVYCVQAVLHPVYHRIYEHTPEPTRNFLGRQEYLQTYRKNLRPMRDFDWITKVHEWFEEGKKKREEKKNANDPEGQQISRETAQGPNTQPP
ncbi:Mg2+ transporter protein CorA-like/Zinc transport protein ZntB [Lasiodiplodia theobromae]|uniref:Mg2+ transporter protein CorA-like/Zinc transport protein ZntB n=1 Tax=Lasiodiplodia theobromae TaxID=45133 RepID=UPI0015C379FE|nr:Mg2+ transporter protein CorA-like/Zinc transport protein ZntB [Lasiodiplodia theobromae]KAF4539134.1 Mg2+ transporter protein CorA-like/Zinc transport protein ZntB [Lasiodiplodia theobromae]